MLFFVLSGFLMGHLYLRQNMSRVGLEDYARARVGRVFPLFAATVLLSAVIYSLDPRFPFRMDALETIKHLLLFGDTLTLWTISVEFQFYFAFIFVWWLNCAWDGPKELRISVFCLLFILIILSINVPDGRISLALYAPYFLAGVLTSVVYRRLVGTAALRFLGECLPALLVIYVLSWPMIAGDGMTEIERYRSAGFVVLSAAIVLAATASQGLFCERFVASRLLVYLGEISFGIYLLHRPVIYFWRDFLAVQLPWPFMFGVVVASVIAASHLANIWIERPARQAFRRRRGPVGAAAARPA